MVQHLTLAAAVPPPDGPVASAPPDATAQIEAFWRHLRLKTAVYLAQAHGLPRPQAMEEARRVIASVRRDTYVPDRETALGQCLIAAAARAEALGRALPVRPAELPVAGLPMNPQPLAPILIAPSPVVGAARLWAMAAAAMVVPALAAFAALVLV